MTVPDPLYFQLNFRFTLFICTKQQKLFRFCLEFHWIFDSNIRIVDFLNNFEITQYPYFPNSVLLNIILLWNTQCSGMKQRLCIWLKIFLKNPGCHYKIKYCQHIKILQVLKVSAGIRKMVLLSLMEHMKLHPRTGNTCNLSLEELETLKYSLKKALLTLTHVSITNIQNRCVYILKGHRVLRDGVKCLHY